MYEMREGCDRDRRKARGHCRGAEGVDCGVAQGEGRVELSEAEMFWDGPHPGSRSRRRRHPPSPSPPSRRRL